MKEYLKELIYNGLMIPKKVNIIKQILEKTSSNNRNTLNIKRPVLFYGMHLPKVNLKANKVVVVVLTWVVLLQQKRLPKK